MHKVKSTNVRNNLVPVVRRCTGGLSRLAPGVAAAVAMRIFERPRRSRCAPGLWRTYAAEAPIPLRLGPHRLDAWSWGYGPAVLLVHGWNSRAGHLACFVPVLLERGYRVIAFDAPGHGSSTGSTTNLLEMAAAIRAAASLVGSLHGVIAHSLGCLATAYAQHEGLAAGRLVFVSPPAEMAYYSRLFAETCGFTPEVHDLMRSRYERRLAISWDHMSIEHLATAQDAPLLVVHDRRDPVVPWHHGRRVRDAWAGSRLLTTEGLGHARILADPTVVRYAANFLTGAAIGVARPDPPREDRVPSPRG